MSDLTCVDNTQVRVLRFARRLLCLPLPEGFVPPVERDALDVLSERVGEALALEQLTPRLVKLGEAQWMMVFFHGPERLHRMEPMRRANRVRCRMRRVRWQWWWWMGSIA